MTTYLIAAIALLVVYLFILLIKNTNLSGTIDELQSENDALRGEMDEFHKEHDELIKKLAAREYEVSSMKNSSKTSPNPTKKPARRKKNPTHFV